MKIIFEDKEYDYNEELSFKVFTNQDLSDRDIPPGTIIYGSSFLQEVPDKHAFKDDMTGVTFVRCVLDNVFIPEGNSQEHTVSQQRFEVQNDLNDWLIDESNDPIEPVDTSIYVALDLPIPDPADIPSEPVDEVVDLVETARSIQLSNTQLINKKL